MREGGVEQITFHSSFFSKSYFAILKSHFHFWFLTFFSQSQSPNPSPNGLNPIFPWQNLPIPIPILPLQGLQCSVLMLLGDNFSLCLCLFDNYIFFPKKSQPWLIVVDHWAHTSRNCREQEDRDALQSKQCFTDKMERIIVGALNKNRYIVFYTASQEVAELSARLIRFCWSLRINFLESAVLCFVWLS